MASLEVEAFVTPEEYLEFERAAEYKNEYYNGCIYAMSGASRKHVLISVNISRELSTQLKGKPCETYGLGMRVRVSETGAYVYPDVVVACGEPQFEDGHVDTLLNPVLVIEVLSPSTEARDRKAKFAHYRRLASLQEYVMIAQDHPHAELYARQPDNHWPLSEYDGLDAALRLESVGCELPLREIYDRIVFPEADARTPPDARR